MCGEAQQPASEILHGCRVAFVGRLASMSKREAAQLARRHGATVAPQPDASVTLVVVGEKDLPLPEGDELEAVFDGPTREAVERGAIELIAETQLWQRLEMVDSEQQARRLYTPAMLAELLGVPVTVIRRWHRRGLIVPAREVRKLAYFDFQEVATARRLAELLAAGMSPAAIEKKLADLARFLPNVKRPLAQLSVIVEGKKILLRQGDGLVEPGGQLRFDFQAAESDALQAEQALAPGDAAHAPLSLSELERSAESTLSCEQMCRIAAELEDSGELEAAAEMYRAAMAAAGPKAEICFQLAELLYRLGDITAARERYYAAIELDEDYVEARDNLGCVLAETGQRELAVAAFEGALAYHPDYADAHHHLACTLEELGRTADAQKHWQALLDQAPNSPWADHARARLADVPPD